jgi:hypothetical protein
MYCKSQKILAASFILRSTLNQQSTCAALRKETAPAGLDDLYNGTSQSKGYFLGKAFFSFL